MIHALIRYPMQDPSTRASNGGSPSLPAAAAIGAGLVIGLAVLGLSLNTAVKTLRGFDRTVTVRGLAEQEHPADVVIWPVAFTQASNDQATIYADLERDAQRVIAFLVERGVPRDEISVDVPSVVDRSAQRWGGELAGGFRYVGSQTVTVYSQQVEAVRAVMAGVGELGRQGVTISAPEYGSSAQYLFTRLNEIKPAMVEQATVEARKVAEKFAQDSNSRLGKIKTASQGQFSISDRDFNNPHIKNVRVVSTVVYYLAD